MQVKGFNKQSPGKQIRWATQYSNTVTGKESGQWQTDINWVKTKQDKQCMVCIQKVCNEQKDQ